MDIIPAVGAEWARHMWRHWGQAWSWRRGWPWSLYGAALQQRVARLLKAKVVRYFRDDLTTVKCTLGQLHQQSYSRSQLLAVNTVTWVITQDKSNMKGGGEIFSFLLSYDKNFHWIFIWIQTKKEKLSKFRIIPKMWKEQYQKIFVPKMLSFKTP